VIFIQGHYVAQSARWPKGYMHVLRLKKHPYGDAPAS
jgi:hypothetical protein